MDSTFNDDERLYRAVLPKDMYWKSDGTLSSAAFYDPYGLSVERGYNRKTEDVIKTMKNRKFRGSLVSVKVATCKDVEAVVKYKPSPNSEYHSEIHGSEEKALLSNKQRKKIADGARVEGKL